MSINDFLLLARLLLMYRANFAMSHRFRNTIDEIAIDCLRHVSQLGIEDRELKSDDLPF